jgi:hypothetical protein
MNVALQKPIRFKLPVPDERLELPVPDDSSDCLSELQMIGSMMTEMEKSINFFKSAINTSSFPHSIVASQTASFAASDILSDHSSSIRNDQVSKAPGTSTAATLLTQDLGANGFIPHVSGSAVSPQLKQMQYMATATLPSVDALESTAPLELSEISPAAHTRVREASERTYYESNLFEQDILFENRRLFHTPRPAPSSSALSPALRVEPLKSLNTSKSNYKSSFLDSSFTGGLAPQVAVSLQPLDAVKMLGDSTTKLRLKLQAMHAKNREIDLTLSQIREHQALTTNHLTTSGIHERDSCYLQQNSKSLERDSQKPGPPSQISGSLSSLNSKMGTSSNFQPHSNQ